MVYSSNDCDEEGGVEEAVAPAVVLSEAQDVSKLTVAISPATDRPALAKKDFDDDDGYLKLSDLPEDYFDDLLDFDFSAPAKKPKLQQLILLGNCLSIFS